MEEEEKKELEEESEKKRKEKPWYKRLHPLVLAGAALFAFLVFQSIMIDSENIGRYIFWLGLGGVVLYLFAQSPKASPDEMISPKEAELLVERECERKRRWKQFPPMSQYVIGPVSDLFHKDARGIYYDVAIKVTHPFDRPKHYIGKVMAKGPEKGFVTIIETIGPMTGREKVQEKSIIPPYIRAVEDHPFLEKLFGER